MKLRNRFVIRMIARGVAATMKLWFLTVRIRADGPAGVNPVWDFTPDSERFLYPIWHDSICVPLFARRTSDMSALTSGHADGEYIAEMLKVLQISAVRGSSRRGGAAAIRRLMDEVGDKHATITPDGPRGPRRVMKQGIIYLASQSGRRIVPTACSATREIRIQASWTDGMVPRLFSTAFVVFGDPIAIPSDLTRAQIEEEMARVQAAMDRVVLRAEQLARGEDVSRDEMESLRSAA